MLQTRALRDGEDYLISGTKWFITGAEGAGFAIIMAKMEDGTATMFLADMDRPGIRFERLMDSLDSCFTGGHGVLHFDQHAAWMLDQGAQGNFESSLTKVLCSEAVWRVVDRCVQVLGGQGVTAETVVMRIFKDIRAFRIYDGPSEVHRWSIERKIIGAAPQA